MELSNNDITIVGAGLAGSLLSVYLAKKGFNVEVYERRPDMRVEDIGGGRSINLALSTRGIHALKEVGLYDEIKEIAIPMYGRMIHTLDGQTQLQPYGKDNTEYINSVSRAELNKRLMTLAEQSAGKDSKIQFHFNERCTGINFEKGETYFHNDKTGQSKIIKERVIATDGATSAVRMEMLKVPRFNFSQVYENYGYKELCIPPDSNGEFRMYKNALHIWPRGAYMLIALPNMDGSFTCTLFLAYDEGFGGENSFEYLDSDERITEFFKKNFPDALEMMPTLVEDFNRNPAGTLITIKCYPWAVADKGVLLGDAAHAIVPFFGQGMNAAFEDCTYLSECIDKYNGDWMRIFDEFQKMRKANADAIADLAQENFIEMRDLVADPHFLLMKKVEAELYKKFPERFMPKYSMVTFHRLPYATALERGKTQSYIMNELISEAGNFEGINWYNAEKLILNNLPELKI